ncbi:hypothetical protein XENORESO_010343 [Xenotaenia resolanae]|uniref:Uncharacterized protein n=1 Tax=Xenotaenia resolanae TaxID=208358 RepID=A0ABV0WRX4_9TELE
MHSAQNEKNLPPSKSVALAAAEELKHLRKKVGENVTFNLEAQKLKHDDMVVWSYHETQSVIFSVHIGKDNEPNQLKRFSLNMTTGSLTVHDLSSGDTAVYLGQIINGNGKKILFNLTVVGKWLS